MQPEHFNLSSPVFLPVTDETCTGLLGTDGAKTLMSLTDPELAAVLVIQNLAQAAEKDLTCAGAERILAKLLDWAVDNRAEGAATLLSEAQRLFDPRKLYFGFNALKTVNLRLLSPEEVAARDYLLPTGKWDIGYKVRHLKYAHPDGVIDPTGKTFNSLIEEAVKVPVKAFPSMRIPTFLNALHIGGQVAGFTGRAYRSTDKTGQPLQAFHHRHPC
jgi:hypothetical protein